MPPAVVSNTIKEINVAVFRTLMEDDDNRIQWPDVEQQREFSDMILLREPEHAFGFVDCCSFPVGVGCSLDEQNAYYNSWKSGTFVNNRFVFAPNGKSYLP